MGTSVTTDVAKQKLEYAVKRLNEAIVDGQPFPRVIFEQALRDIREAVDEFYAAEKEPNNAADTTGV